MKHLTSDEIIDFVSMTALDDRSLKNAAAVTGHIAQCEACLRKVNAFQVIFDEFSELGLYAENKQELYRLTEPELTEPAKQLQTENEKRILSPRRWNQ